MKRQPAAGVLVVLALSLSACATTGAGRDRERFEPYRAVAVVDVQTEVLVQRGTARRTVEEVLRLLQLRGIGEQGASSDDEEALLRDGLRNQTIDLLNKNLVDRGFYAIQRDRLDGLLSEQELQQAGGTRDAAQLGQLVKADAVIVGRLVLNRDDSFQLVREGGLLPSFRGRYEIAFSADITTVEEGYILYSEVISETGTDFGSDVLVEVVEQWARGLPRF